jgi:hypothetical protein
MKSLTQSGETPLCARSSQNRAARSRQSEESGFAFLMALGMMLILLAVSLVVLQNFATDGKRTREEETIWRGEQYERAIRLYYHKMGHYPQTMDDLEKGGLQLHFLRQAYKNPMNKTDGTWRFIYVNATGQIIGSVRYATLQQMVMIDQYAGMLPGAAPTGPMPAQLGVSAASLASSSGSGNSQQLQGLLAGILSSVPADTSTGSGAGSSQPLSDSSQSTASQSGSSGQSADPSNGQAPVTAGQAPANISPTPDQLAQYAQSGQLPPGITPQMVTQYLQTGQLPPGITQDQVNQFTQSLQNQQNPQNPTQPGQSTFGPAPSGQSGSLSFGPTSTSQSSLSGAAVNPLLLMKPTGPVDGPVLGAFLTGVACTTDVKSLKVYRRGKKYLEWEFIWNPLEDAAGTAQQALGNPQGTLGPGQASGMPGSNIGGNGSSQFGNSPMMPTSPGPQQPPVQQPQPQ